MDNANTITDMAKVRIKERVNEGNRFPAKFLAKFDEILQ